MYSHERFEERISIKRTLEGISTKLEDEARLEKGPGLKSDQKTERNVRSGK